LLSAVDVSRVADTFARNQLPNVVLVGREVDLLERMRRSTKDETLSIKTVSLHASDLQIDPLQFSRSLQAFKEFRMIEESDSETYLLRFVASKEVYEYGYNRLTQLLTERELILLDFIAKSMKRPQSMSELERIIDLFDREFRKGLQAFINAAITPKVTISKEEYAVSSRIFREKEVFKNTLDTLEANKLGDILSVLQSNPGIPKEETAKQLGLEATSLDMLSKSGIIDPLNLDVGGDAKTYLFGTDIMSKRADFDHLDLVKKTLANFRYGEHYSKGSRLYSLEKFFGYMLDHGYAGKATPIGTDYHNLEVAGVVRVKRIPDGRYRFWMLKRDVIQDAFDVIQGYTPFQIGPRTNGVTRIDDVITTRTGTKVQKTKVRKELAEALRDIEEGMV
jgi:hypothetical protein